ncbi:hypothetical protein LSTR_LSTR010886 [Laodelphax striatellus]|uniref:Uncharacterized protein n=1 Tax=Laodelphax striatellus TaxID=195883 RepID=A0A482XKL3_LAOST|nr:hypothetical protein LSTR_LSTR010886 [Laodelphax striatellus]
MVVQPSNIRHPTNIPEFFKKDDCLILLNLLVQYYNMISDTPISTVCWLWDGQIVVESICGGRLTSGDFGLHHRLSQRASAEP